MTALTFVAMLPVNVVAMFVTFTKISQMFDPNQIQAQARHQQRLKGVQGWALLVSYRKTTEEDVIVIHMTLNLPSSFI
jgi:hypothetical protein